MAFVWQYAFTDSPPEVLLETLHTKDDIVAPGAPIRADGATRAFNLSIIVSGIRCTLTYVVLPFLLPFLGLAPGIGPVLGLGIGAVAIVANVVSIRRFWLLQHPYRKPVTVLHVAMIGFLAVLMWIDIGELINLAA